VANKYDIVAATNNSVEVVNNITSGNNMDAYTFRRFFHCNCNSKWSQDAEEGV